MSNFYFKFFILFVLDALRFYLYEMLHVNRGYTYGPVLSHDTTFQVYGNDFIKQTYLSCFLIQSEASSHL